MKSDNWFIRIRKALTPLMVYLIVAVIVEFAFAFFAGYVVLIENGMSISQEYAKYTELTEAKIKAWSLVMVLVVQVICIPVFATWYIKEKKRFTVESLKINPVAYPAVFILGGAVAIFLNGALILSGLFSLLESTYESSADTIYNSGNNFVMYLTAVVLAPVMEELMFRGITYKRLRTYCIFTLAALLSAILFGIYHFNLLQFIYATVLGLILAFAFESFRNVIAPILLHSGANLLSVVLTTNEKFSKLVLSSQTNLMVATFLGLVLAFFCMILIRRLSLKAVNTGKEENISE